MWNQLQQRKIAFCWICMKKFNFNNAEWNRLLLIVKNFSHSQKITNRKQFVFSLQPWRASKQQAIIAENQVSEIWNVDFSHLSQHPRGTKMFSTKIFFPVLVSVSKLMKSEVMSRSNGKYENFQQLFCSSLERKWKLKYKSCEIFS